MCEFIEYVEGKSYYKLDYLTTEFFQKTRNKLYFTRYIGTYLKYAGLLEYDCSIYEDRRKDWSLTIDKLIQEYEDKVFEFNPNISSDDKAVTTKFSRYISNEDKFEYWRNLYKFLVLSK